MEHTGQAQSAHRNEKHSANSGHASASPYHSCSGCWARGQRERPSGWGHRQDSRPHRSSGRSTVEESRPVVALGRSQTVTLPGLVSHPAPSLDKEPGTISEKPSAGLALRAQTWKLSWR